MYNRSYSNFGGESENTEAVGEGEELELLSSDTVLENSYFQNNLVVFYNVMQYSTVVNSEVVESTLVRSSSSISSMRGQRRRPRDESDSIDLAIFEELRESRRRREMRAETESNAAMSFGRIRIIKKTLCFTYIPS